MEIQWTSKANSDLVRLYGFLSPSNPLAAAKTVQTLSLVPERLLDNPRIGEQLEEFNPREIRHVFPGNFEMRYEIANEVIYILRIWHTREDR